MRRADRLFQIGQLLRGRHVVKAAELAREVEVSLRTIYRDVADLIVSGIPVEGEAGVGYCLSHGFDLPRSCSTRTSSPLSRSARAWCKPGVTRRGRAGASDLTQRGTFGVATQTKLRIPTTSATSLEALGIASGGTATRTLPLAPGSPAS